MCINRAIKWSKNLSKDLFSYLIPLPIIGILSTCIYYRYHQRTVSPLLLLLPTFLGIFVDKNDKN